MMALLVATACAGLFAGAAIYVTSVEHPARMAEGPELAVREFAPSYGRGKIMQAVLALVGGVSGVLAFWAGRDVWILVASMLLLAPIPFTLVFIMPTTKQLLDPALEASSSRAVTLLTRWGQRHAVRTVLGSVAFLVFLWRLANG
jgi:uncharacterized membrane protein